MNLRVLRTELRRSVALPAGAVVLTAALAFLYLINGGWWEGTTAWTAQWTPMALWLRGLLFYLWPLVVGLGALQGLRDHRSRIPELLTSTSRPAWHRAATTAGASVITLASASALLVLVGAVHVLSGSAYPHLGWLPIAVVGALSLVAGAVLGMGAGRALPSPLTPPALAMTAFVFTALMHMSLGRTETTTASGFPASEPNGISLLSPAVEEVRHVLVTLSGAVHAGQTIWFLGLAATGFALLIAETPRARLIALTPLLAGAVTALLVLPSDPRQIYVVDRAAAELVCDGPVCVTKTHEARLAELVGPGKKALSLLRDALGDRAPDSVREKSTVPPGGATPQWSRETVLFTFDDGVIASSADGVELTRALIAQSMAPGCVPAGWSSTGGTDIAAAVAVAWVVGEVKPLPGSSGDLRGYGGPGVDDVWKELTALPRAEQLSRISAMRAAALTCEGDPLDVLTGGESR
ncbi:hypothetical protein [Streptomyces zingiberis]|uniref:Uncharacterized protein n=1 Tax=Streptomyces zingiberis TaxID=2053010 RepID=A0ABX1BPY2_9ACTN|nr:hypothetical protein [Streptomyces zingiberis]NJP99107.1 hypothetical protein [Streptomyces zingiberis]